MNPHSKNRVDSRQSSMYPWNMKQTYAIKCLSALAHDGRLSIMRRLIKVGPSGMASGALARAENIGVTTASAQLLVLLNSDLVRSVRRGRRVIYEARFETFQGLLTFLMEDCCQEGEACHD